MKTHANADLTKDDFIAPARRAFRRVARKLRAENAQMGLPLAVTCGSSLNGLRLKVAAKVHGKKK
jgi:hypothetical protein